MPARTSDISKQSSNENQKFKYRREDWGVLIFDERTWNILKANETGAQIMTLLNGKRTIIQIAQELTSLYWIAPELILCDIELFIGLLQKLNIVKGAKNE